MTNRSDMALSQRMHAPRRRRSSSSCDAKTERAGFGLRATMMLLSGSVRAVRRSLTRIPPQFTVIAGFIAIGVLVQLFVVR